MLCCGNSNNNNFSCEVLLLDDTVLPFKDNIHFKNSVKTQTIFDAVCDHLNLAEKDYFGLYYQDNNGQTHWIDLYRTFREHEGLLQGESPHKLHFGVKFFIADPTNLREEITRYYYFLQLKQDILSGKLPCDFKKATELSALVLQSELGDYQRKDHGPGYASEFRFVPNQDEEFENEVERLHKGYSGFVPAEAEMVYLRKCRQLDMYGLDIHSVQDESGMEYIIGLSPRGVEVRKNRRKVKTHYWPLISHIEFKDRQLKIQVKNKNCDDSVYTFMTTTRQACKYLWKRAIEHHAFFRLTESSYTSSSIPLLGKKFGYSGRTEKEMQQFQTNREEPAVLRSRSKRYPSRQSKSGHTPQKTDEGKGELSYPNVEEILADYRSKNQSRNNEESILEKSGLFGTSEISGNRSNYVTPKNERRQRNRNLRSLSDSENKHRSTRHGRSSGEESDSPSKRRIRARNHRARNRNGTEKDMSNHQHKRHYHTDTEMVGGGHLSIQRNNTGIEGAVTDDGGRSETRSNQARRRNRKKKNRLSREDVAAQQKLWNHITRDFEDPEKYTQEQLQDIPYTEVKTEGNPLPIRLRRHSRGSNSPKYRRTSTHSSGEKSHRKSSSTIVGDGLVSPLSVTTTVRRDKIALGTTNPNNNFNMNDWDTKSRSYNHRRYPTSTNC